MYIPPPSLSVRYRIFVFLVLALPLIALIITGVLIYQTHKLTPQRAQTLIQAVVDANTTLEHTVTNVQFGSRWCGPFDTGTTGCSIQVYFLFDGEPAEATCIDYSLFRKDECVVPLRGG